MTKTVGRGEGSWGQGLQGVAKTMWVQPGAWGAA